MEAVDEVSKSFSQYTSLFSSLGVAAILGWYLWYTTSVSFPKISAQHLERFDSMLTNQDKVVSNMTKAFKDVSAEQRRDFLDALAEERQNTRDMVNMMKESFVCPAKHLLKIDEHR